MNADTILVRLRLFLLGTSAFLLIGTLVELVAIGHTKEPIQLVPFILCILGLAIVSVALARPARKSLMALRAVMIPVTLGSLLGVWEHVENNAAFYLEVHPTATTTQLVGAALGGASPLLAPGMLALAAALAVAATYYHPALLRRHAAASEQARYLPSRARIAPIRGSISGSVRTAPHYVGIGGAPPFSNCGCSQPASGRRTHTSQQSFSFLTTPPCYR